MPFGDGRNAEAANLLGPEAAIDLPSIRTSPDAIGNAPAVARTSELLPAPLAPSKAVTCPGGISKNRFICALSNGALPQLFDRMARPKRFELLTPRFVVWCSIQLSYGRVFACAFGP
jgi:hypothetical protein